MKLLVTGGSSDLAKAIIAHRSQIGDECYFTASSPESLKKTQDFYDENKISAKGLIYNFSDKKIEKTEFDGVVLNAAAKMKVNKKVTELSFEEIQEYVSSEVFGNLSLLQQILPQMEKNEFGRIVFISSLSTVIGTSNYPSYIMAKSSLEGLIRNIAVDYAKHNILANSLRLGVFKTSRLRALWKRDFYQKAMSDLIVQGRMGEAQDLIGPINMLLAKDLYTTGTLIDLAGGLPMVNSSK